MRRPERIPNILGELGRIWTRHPDLRLGQLIGNVVDGPALYHIEDIELLQLLSKTYTTPLKKHNRR